MSGETPEVRKPEVKKPETVKLKVTAGEGAPSHVAGLAFEVGKAKTVTVDRSREAQLRNAGALKIEEVK